MENRTGGLRGLKTRLLGQPSFTILDYAGRDHKFTMKRRPKPQISINVKGKNTEVEIK